MSQQELFVMSSSQEEQLQKELDSIRRMKEDKENDPNRSSTAAKRFEASPSPKLTVEKFTGLTTSEFFIL